jgi:Spy/CpxP family protein refolding chaperone
MLDVDLRANSCNRDRKRTMAYVVLEAGVWMNTNGLASRVALGAGFFVLCVAPALTGAQSFPPGPAQAAHTVPHAAGATTVPSPADDFEGLKYSDDQQAKIRLIRQDGELRRDAVVKDQKLSSEQKQAMLQGLQRIERGQVYKVLTPEQQAEVRKRIIGRQAAARNEQGKTGQPSPQ